MSTIQIEEGGEVSAWRLIVSSVLSGSKEMMRTVWSSQPTAYAKNINFAHSHGNVLTRYGVR